MSLVTYTAPTFSDLPTYDDFGYLPAAGTFFTLGNRIYVVKGIALPNGVAVINIPVIVQIRFRDPGDNYQDKVWTFDDVDGYDVNVVRVAHSADVYNTGDLDWGAGTANADPTQSIQVERVDSFKVYDQVDNGQASVFSLDNVDGEGTSTLPAHFGPASSSTTGLYGLHAITHLARWFASDGNGNITDPNTFVDTEYIDQCVIQDRYSDNLFWNFRYTIKNNWVNPAFNGDGTPAAINPVPASYLGLT